MTNPRPRAVYKLTDRLRGKYEVGPHLPNGEPEFGWRQFETPQIQHEAADEIERLQSENERLIEALNPFSELYKPHHKGLDDDNPIFAIEGSIVTAGDLRRAAKLIKELGEL